MYLVNLILINYLYAFIRCTHLYYFLLHIVNGVVDELEIVTADLSQINPNDIELGNVVYKIKEELIL